ncbi:LPXTG-motif protein cell wall anchor domain protein [Secundilactobacillus odoratitofui DSM 19909 = JCM 15043]|uniref:LPXTG-motif protein cell wall anchor domain protein n=1 Tax=Secundilactobacillus odoratitofui DSM 19909 = JCM 15043 TaxID=1423776 RepID=A0A0R1LPV4_9LACO|nr:LPXTG-motif protein cell wall anchor domain protein [Secundilactobacillus odoratitofui DSM 19909 = JCM 15043]
MTSAEGIQVSLSTGIVPPENGWQLDDFDVSHVDTDAGTYTIKLSDTGLSRLQQQNPNYAITDDTTSVTGNYQILKADANAQIVSPGDKTYDGISDTDPKTYDIIINGDKTKKVTLDKSYFTDNNGNEDVGTYTIALTGEGFSALHDAFPNYDFTADSVKTGSFKITPAPVTLSFENWSDDYGQPTTLSNKQAIIYYGKPEKGTDIKASLTDNSMDTNAGTYTIDISVDTNANPNYTITTQSGTYIVNQIPGSVTISNKTKTYDGDESTDPDIYDVQLNDGATDGVTDINWQSSDFEDTNADNQNAGSTHTITLSQSGLDRLNAANRNFKFNASVVTTGTLTINKAPITITAPTVSKIYDGQAYGDLPAATVIGLPAKGVALNYDLTDVSGDTEANEGYAIDVLNYSDNNPNYDIAPVAGKLTIQKKSVVATVEDYTRPYDATKNVDWQTLVTLPEDTNLPSDWSEADFDFSAVESDAGSYAITLNQDGITALNKTNPNYQFDLATTKAGTMTITKAPGQLSISGGEKVYDGDSTNVPSVFDVTLPENDQTQIDWQAGDFTGITSSNAGTYTVTLSAAGLVRLNAADKNYQFTSDPESMTPGIYKIDVRNITITAPTLTKVYDGNPYQGDYAATITNTVDGSALPSTAVKPTYSLTDITGDKKATDSPIEITVDADANANYIITPVSGSLTITKAPMSITSIAGGKVYDGQELTNASDITVTVPNQLKQVDWDVSDFTVTKPSANKGQYLIGLSEAGQGKLTAANPNYDIQNLDITGQYVINQAVGAAQLDTSAEKPYDGLDGTNPSTFNLYVNGDTTNPLKLTSDQFVIAGNSQNVGTYTVSLTSAGLDALKTAYPNYTFKDTDIQDGSFTITPMAITIAAPTWSDTYGEKGQIPAWTADKTLTGVQPDVTITPTADIKNAGQYDITISYQADSSVNKNYIITTVPGKYTINEAIGSVKIADASKVYDGNAATDAQIYQVTLDDDAKNVNWATTDFSVDNSEGQHVGSKHTITLSAAGLAKLNTANTNYTYDVSSVHVGTLTISKAKVQIVGQSVSKVYDGNAYDQSKLEQAVQVNGQPVLGDKVIYTVADMSQTVDVGKDYTIGITATAEDNPNYDITEITNGTLTITPKPISVNLSSGSTTYGDDYFDATTMIPSISTGDTLNVPSDWTNVDYALPDLTSSNVGDYMVTLSSDGVDALKAANSNYEFDNASGTLTIDKKQISVTAISGTKVYDGTTLADPSTISVTLSDGLVTPPLTSKDFDINIAPGGDVGNYDITLNAQGIKDLNAIYPNYDFSSERMVTGSYEITKAPITITAPNVTKQYDGNGYDKPLIPTFIGLPTSGVTPDYVINGKDAVDAGQHDLLVSVDANSHSNYTITTNPGKLTITQKPVTAEMGTNSVVYGTYVDQEPIFQFTDSGGNIVAANTPLLTSDDIQVDGGADFAKTVNVGKYVVQLTTAGIQKLRDANPNYDLTIIDGGYWVTPATKHLTVIGGTRLYDGTSGVTSADHFTIQASDGVTIPKFDSNAFDTSQVGQDAGRYNVKLTAVGLDELNKANKNYQFTLSDIDDGTYTIIPKSVTVTGPDYEDQTYTGEPITSVMNSTISGLVPGEQLTITEPDLSQVINVGTYTLTPIVGTNLNYNITVVPTTVTINKAKVHVSFSEYGLGKYYDGDTSIVPQTFVLTADNPDFTIPEMTSTDFDTTGITSQNVHDYPVKLSTAGLAKLTSANPNYEVDANEGLFAIVKAPVIITMPNIVKQYDGQPVTDLTDQIDISGVPAKGVALDYTPTDVSQVTEVNTGSPLTLTAKFDENTNSNYDIQVTPGTLTINRADGSAKIEGGTQTYNGTLPTVFTVTLPTSIASQASVKWEASDFVVTSSTGLTNGQVGDYTVNLSDAGLAKLNSTFTNYQFSSGSIQPGTYHVTPATGNITIGTTQTVYAKDADLKAGLASLVTVTDKTAKIDWTDDDFVVTPAEGQADGSVGRHSVTLSDAGLAKLAAASPNYQYGRDHETAGTLNVTAAHGTITLGTASKVYDGEKYVVGAVPSVTLPDGVILPTTLAQTPNDFDFDAIPSQNVGSYDLSLSQAGIDAINAANPNYFFTLSDVVAGKYMITRAPITINAPTITKVYDGLSYEGDDANAMVYGMPNYGEPLRITFTDISNDVNVGEYDLGVSAHEYLNPNYSFTVNPGKLTITKALGVVTSMTTTKVYDGDATTDPTVLQVTLPEGEVAPEWTAEDFDFSHVDSQNAGRYEVQLTQAGVAALNAVNPNYNFTTETILPGTFTITPATITLSVPTMTKTFDGTPYSEPTKVVVTGLPAMGVIPVAELSDYSQLTAAGTYPVSVIANAADNPNYTLNLVAGNLVIKQANGTAVISDSGKTYDHDATKLPTDLTVKLPELAVAPKWTQADFDFSGITDQSVGTYPINLSQQGLAKLNAVNPNYVFDGAAGSYTISPAEASVTVSDATKPYDGNADHLPTGLSVTLPDGLDTPVLDSSDFDYTGITSQNVGHYQLTLSEAGIDKLNQANPNYHFDLNNVTPGDYAITPAKLKVGDVSLTVSDKQYDGHGLTDLPKVYLFKEQVLAAWTTEDFTTTANPDVGTYTVTLSQSGLDKLSAQYPNYVFNVNAVTAGRYQITPKPVIDQIFVGDGSKAYDGTTQLSKPVQVTLPTGWVSPDWSTEDFTTLSSSHVGDSEIGLSQAGLTQLAQLNPNYDVTQASVVKGIYHVTPAIATIVVNNQTRAEDASDGPLSASVTGVVTGDVLNYQITRQAGQTVGQYPISVVLGDNPDYHVLVVPGVLTITTTATSNNEGGSGTQQPTGKQTTGNQTGGNDQSNPTKPGNGHTTKPGDIGGTTHKPAHIKAEKPQAQLHPATKQASGQRSKQGAANGELTSTSRMPKGNSWSTTPAQPFVHQHHDAIQQAAEDQATGKQAILPQTDETKDSPLVFIGSLLLSLLGLSGVRRKKKQD